MIAAAASVFGSEVVLGGRAYTVRPPSVRTALAVTAAFEHGGEETDVFLAESVRGWLPLSLRSTLFSRSVRPEERRRVVLSAMLAGVPDERLERAKRQQERVEQEARRRGWSETLRAYRGLYGGEPLSESWPFFLDQAYGMDAEEARRNVHLLQTYAAIRDPSGEAWRAMKHLAGMGPVARVLSDEEREANREQAAYVRAQFEARKRVQDSTRWREFMPGTFLHAETGEA